MAEAPFGVAMRIVIASALALTVLLAGCFENDSGPPTLDDDSEQLENVPMRTLAQGQQSGVGQRERLVIETDEDWNAFWQKHVRLLSTPPAAPEVNFTTERVIAVVIDSRPSGCWTADITNALTDGEQVQVEVHTNGPKDGTSCPTVVSFPFHFIAVPHGGSVLFAEIPAA